MREITCVVVGGGYAGIHAAKEMAKSLSEGAKSGLRLRLIVIDKKPDHLRKVLLFKPAAAREKITVPLESLLPEGAERMQAEVTRVETERKNIVYVDPEGKEHELAYDVLVLAAGSVVRSPGPEQGGIPLKDVAAAEQIRAAWQANIEQAVRAADPLERQKYLTLVVAGAGISGIETAAELASAMRAEVGGRGMDPAEVNVYLCNAHSRLFPEGPAKVGEKLEQSLASLGVTVLHGAKVTREANRVVSLSGGREIPAELCVWTLGLSPHPMLRKMGLPLTGDGYIQVDSYYRVSGAPGVYSIGDCAHIIDPVTGRPDGKTCKEATAQAARLAKVVHADLAGEPAPPHRGYTDLFCFGLGPGQGLVWTRKWGLDLIIAGRLGWRIRKYTWDLASLLK